ncbi:hypothetical protein IAQ61_007432 [Plenodomus lingam]|uniref:Predicted protein n=1 Tax=Leptosphaeria maculans (strain JN3 / isolate v23.1.3 / race Av1-4-5-6-7-8) TaxID=985895 RepID=E5A5R2_LEPMJ|nr:predicted protein [Plenodomus lingam JN3]KAH9866843.1 hypothetical protein IAQ61_007432 [Plenodomus lingam]CBX98960.1 predicted protein [Plenodomus lingam JN3]
MVQANDRFDRYLQWLSGPQKETSKTAVLGGFPYLLDGTVASAYRKLAREIDALQVPKEVKETTKLAVAAHYGATGEIAWLSSQIKALTTSQVDSIIRRTKPTTLTLAGSAAYDAVTYLVGTPGPLPPQYWETCVDTLGKSGTIGILHLVGLNIGASMISNAIDAPIISVEELSAVKED